MVENDWREYVLRLFPSDYIDLGGSLVQITPDDYPHGAYAIVRVHAIAAPEREDTAPRSGKAA